MFLCNACVNEQFPLSYDGCLVKLCIEWGSYSITMILIELYPCCSLYFMGSVMIAVLVVVACCFVLVC